MKIGDYVRTKDYGIHKITNFVVFDDIEYIVDNNSMYYTKIDKREIIKSSPNIIDLLEKGDYVNGYKVLFAGATTWDNDGNVIDKRVEINYDGYDRWLSEDFIKSIVTKESFKEMEYEVK